MICALNWGIRLSYANSWGLYKLDLSACSVELYGICYRYESLCSIGPNLEELVQQTFVMKAYLVIWWFQVSLSSIKGTGPEGSIVKADVEEYLGNYLNQLVV